MDENSIGTAPTFAHNQDYTTQNLKEDMMISPLISESLKPLNWNCGDKETTFSTETAGEHRGGRNMAQGELSGDVNAARSQLGTFVSKKVGSTMLRIDHFRTVAFKPLGD